MNKENLQQNHCDIVELHEDSACCCIHGVQEFYDIVLLSSPLSDRLSSSLSLSLLCSLSFSLL